MIINKDFLGSSIKINLIKSRLVNIDILVTSINKTDCYEISCVYNLSHSKVDYYSEDEFYTDSFYSYKYPKELYYDKYFYLVSNVLSWSYRVRVWTESSYIIKNIYNPSRIIKKYYIRNAIYDSLDKYLPVEIIELIIKYVGSDKLYVSRVRNFEYGKLVYINDHDYVSIYVRSEGLFGYMNGGFYRKEDY